MHAERQEEYSGDYIFEECRSAGGGRDVRRGRSGRAYARFIVAINEPEATCRRTFVVLPRDEVLRAVCTRVRVQFAGRGSINLEYMTSSPTYLPTCMQIFCEIKKFTDVGAIGESTF